MFPRIYRACIIPQNEKKKKKNWWWQSCSVRPTSRRGNHVLFENIRDAENHPGKETSCKEERDHCEFFTVYITIKERTHYTFYFLFSYFTFLLLFSYNNYFRFFVSDEQVPRPVRSRVPRRSGSYEEYFHWFLQFAPTAGATETDLATIALYRRSGQGESEGVEQSELPKNIFYYV